MKNKLPGKASRKYPVQVQLLLGVVCCCLLPVISNRSWAADVLSAAFSFVRELRLISGRPVSAEKRDARRFFYNERRKAKWKIKINPASA